MWKPPQEKAISYPSLMTRSSALVNWRSKPDVNVSTIRFWLTSGLLEVSETTPSGYQLFSASMVVRVEEIKALKEQRFTIQEIKSKLIDKMQVAEDSMNRYQSTFRKLAE